MLLINLSEGTELPDREYAPADPQEHKAVLAHLFRPQLSRPEESKGTAAHACMARSGGVP